MKIEQLFAEYKGLNKQQLIQKGRAAYAKFGEIMDRKGYNEKEIVQFATMLVRVAAGADRYGSDEELELFQEVTGIKTDKYEFALMAKNADNESFVNAIDEIVDSLDQEAKDAALVFAAIFFASDNHLNKKEIALFERLEA